MGAPQTSGDGRQERRLGDRWLGVGKIARTRGPAGFHNQSLVVPALG